MLLRRPLCTLHDVRCRTPCNTRFRLVGWPLPRGSFTRWTAMLGFSINLHLCLLPARDWLGTMVFHHDIWSGKARPGDVFTVNAIEGERAELVHDDGRTLRVRPGGRQLRYQLELHETATIRIRDGDAVRWTRNDNRRKLMNGEQARVLAIRAKIVRFRTGDGRSVRLSRDEPQLRHMDLAYSSTVHAAQGLTADRVIAVLDSGHGAFTDQATFYVEVRQARDEVVVQTDNREQLAETLKERTGSGRRRSKPSAR